MDGSTVSKQVGATNSAIGGGGASYLVYTALMNQVDPGEGPWGNPTVTILENTTGSTITWTRTAQGIFKGTANTSLFIDESKVALYAGYNINAAIIPNITTISSTEVEIRMRGYTYNGDLSPTNLYNDGGFNNTLVEIRIYP